MLVLSNVALRNIHTHETISDVSTTLTFEGPTKQKQEPKDHDYNINITGMQTTHSSNRHILSAHDVHLIISKRRSFKQQRGQGRRERESTVTFSSASRLG
jgi:hypothetical protein